MELTIKKDFKLSSVVQKYQVVLDTLALMDDGDNFTTSGIKLTAMIALLTNACEEDVIELYNQAEEQSFDFCLNVIEPHVNKLLGDKMDYLDDVVSEVVAYKERSIDMSGKLIYSIKKVLSELSELDTHVISDIILSATSLKQTAIKEAQTLQEEQRQEQVAQVDDKLQQLINQFTKQSA